MVGVPGRSNACHACKRRKIKCGAQRPTCSNCSKSQRICPGYHRNHVFILSKDVTLKADGPTQQNNAHDGLVLISRWRSPVTSYTAQGAAAPKGSALAPYPYDKGIDSGPAISLRHVYRDQVFSLGILSYARISKCNDLAKESGGTQQNWLEDALKLPTLDPPLEQALLAISASRVGRRNLDDRIIQQSLFSYIIGMSKLRKALRDPKSMLSVQTMAACTMLHMYEYRECPGRSTNALQLHYNAAMSLLERRGPEAHRVGLAHEVFRFLRISTVYHGLVFRSESFLAQPAWREVPFSATEKDAFDSLIDIALELPELYRHSDAMALEPHLEGKISSAITIAQKCDVLLERLSTWLGRLEQAVAGPLYLPKLAIGNNVTDGDHEARLFPVAFYFPAFAVAKAMVLYWIIQIIVCQQLDMAHECFRWASNAVRNHESAGILCTCHHLNGDYNANKSCFQHSHEPGFFGELVATADWPHTMSPKICQAVEYFFQPQFRLALGSTILPALIIVRKYWSLAPGDWGRQVAWVDAVIHSAQLDGLYATAYTEL